MKKTGYNFVWLWASAAILAALLIAASFLDEKLAGALYLGDNFFTYTVEAAGKLPAFLMGGVGFCVLLRCAAAKENKWYRRVLYAGYFVLGSVCCAVGFKDCYDLAFASTKMSLLVSAAAGGGIFMVMTLLALRKDVAYFEKMKKWAITVLFALVAAALIVEVLKLGWGRARYREILAAGGEFTAWYKPARAGGSSFPSGHAAMAALTALAVPYAEIVGGKDARRACLKYAIVALFTLFVMIGRLAGGYHYLSDVVFGAAVSLAVTAICTRISYGRTGAGFELSEKNIFRKI